MEDGGYDAEFMNVVPDDLSCIVCHLALRDPVQIAECGHRFCQFCFNRIESYSLEKGSEFTCPVDRKNIDKKVVFKDQAAKRAVLSLKVKCDYYKKGCTWCGDLSDLQEHIHHSCKNHIGTQSNEIVMQMGDQIKDLLQRMAECEKYIYNQNLEILSLQEKLHQKELNFKQFQDDLGKQLQSKDKEIEEFKTQLKELQENKGKDSMHVDMKDMLNDGIMSNEEKNKNIEKRVNTIERLNPKMGAFEWHLDNYNHVSNSFEHVESSIFYDYLDGHACQLSVRWFDRRRGRLGVYFHLCKEENKLQTAPFCMKVIIQCIGEDFVKRSYVINDFCHAEEGISGDTEDSSLDESAEYAGDDYFLCKPELDNYIVNDSMHFICFLV